MRKQLILAIATTLILSTSVISFAKTPALTTPSMTDQEYAATLGFTLKSEENIEGSMDSEENDNIVVDHTKENVQSLAQSDDETPLSPEIATDTPPIIEKKDLIYQCDISLAQPFAIKNQEDIELALGDQKGDDMMVIKIRKTPLLMTKTHYEPEHLHIWSNTEHNVLMTLEVEEVYKDKFVALQSGTLTLLTPKLKEDYKAVLSCRP